MIMKVFSVYDSAVGAYMTPFFMQSSGAAIRAFTDITNDLQSAICKHPSDYSLFELGSWDDATCAFTFLTAPVSLGCAIEYKTPSAKPLESVSVGQPASA